VTKFQALERKHKILKASQNVLVATKEELELKYEDVQEKLDRFKKKYKDSQEEVEELKEQLEKAQENIDK